MIDREKFEQMQILCREGAQTARAIAVIAGATGDNEAILTASDALRSFNSLDSSIESRLHPAGFAGLASRLNGR